MSSDPNDRTATLPPREDESAHAGRLPPEADPLLPVDDPDRYEQINEHARGGLGRIVRAIDRRLGRTVAVKELLRRDEWHEARFMREALITARLEHPGIVPVHEAGRWPNGDPYYVMKLVEGRTLKELMASHQGLRDRLALLPHVIAVADAVGYAHSQGVIHRDVKPSNVIVGGFGETIVVDWGLARDSTRELPDPPIEDLLASGSGISTVSGKIVGTPAYMAPEQARGELVDPRADVYAIGAVLYELLVGKAPHADETPQAMLDRVIAGPPLPLAIAAPSVPMELADLVAKAMARDREDRYANATALAEDLRRYQTGKLVSAHVYTVWSVLKKKLAQHRGVVAVALASAVALGAVGVESFRTVVTERDIAESERAGAEAARTNEELSKRELVLVQAQTSLQKDPTAALAWLRLYPVAPRDLEQVVDVVDNALALGVASHVFRTRDWVYDAVFTPDGTHVIAGARDGVVREYDLATGALRVIGKTPSFVMAIALSPDGKTVVTGGVMGDVIAWPVAGGTAKPLIASGKPVMWMEFDPAGDRLIVDHGGHDELVGLDGKITAIGPASARQTGIAPKDWSKRIALVEPTQVAAILPNGAAHVIATTARAIQVIWLSPTGDTVYLHDGETIYSVPFGGGALTKLVDYSSQLSTLVWSPDGTQLAICGKQPDVVVFDIVHRTSRTLRGHTDALYSAQWTKDGTHLLTASDDGTARVWTVADGTSIELRGHDDDVYRAHFSPDEQAVATASLDGSIRIWPLHRETSRVLAEGAEIHSLELTGDRVLVTTPTSVAAWDLVHGTRELVAAVHGSAEDHAVVSPDGTRVLSKGANFTIELSGGDSAPRTLRAHRGPISSLAWSADNTAAYSSSYDGTLRRWDLDSATSSTLIAGTVPVKGFAVAPDGRVAAQVGDAVVMIAPDGTTTTLGTGTAWCISFMRFAGERLFLQRCSESFAIWTHGALVELATDGYSTVGIAVSPDGTRIAGAMTDRTIRIWRSDGVLLSVLRGHDDLVYDVAFSPDGHELASASYDKTVRVWQLDTGRHRVLRGHTAAVVRIVWHGAHELVSGSSDGTIRTWPVPSTVPPTQAELTKRLDAATTARIDAMNRPTTAGS